MQPKFAIRLTAAQSSVLEKIGEYLISHLGFDSYSIYKLKFSSLISVHTQKIGFGNSKQTAVLNINNVHILNNYLIPFLDKLTFMTKKVKDFTDFKLICKAVYCGADRRPDVKSLILKLSLTMNEHRLSTNQISSGSSELTVEERNIINRAEPTLVQLPDGRQKDILTNKVIYLHSTCLYEITNLATGETNIVSTLTAGAEVVGVTYRTLTKYMSTSELNPQVELKGHRIKRIGVLLPFVL